MLYGTKISARNSTPKVVRKTVLSGTLSAKKASTILDAVSVLLTAKMGRLILESPAKRKRMEEEQAILLSVQIMK